MKKSIGFYEFNEEFKAVRPNSFSYEGLKSLFEYIENLEYDCGEEFEFDVIALCCDYAEYTVNEFIQDYDLEIGEDIVAGWRESDMVEESLIAWMEKRGILCAQFVNNDEETAFIIQKC